MYTGEVSVYMATTTQLALFAAPVGSTRIGTLEIVDLTKITSISYGEAGNPSDPSTVLTVAIEGSVREFYVRPLNVTPTQFITDWCDAVGQGGGGGGSGDATSIQGVPVSAAAPTSNQVLAYGGAEWEPTTLSISLQDAYDAGDTINTNAGVAPVLIEQTAGVGNYSLLSVSKVPGAGDAGASAVSFHSGANATGITLDVNNEGSGDHLSVRSGATNYLTIDTNSIRATSSDNVGLILNGSAGTVLLQADGETGISMDATPNDLTLTGRGISINLNEAAATSLSTTAQTLVGAINELDAAIGAAASLQASYDVGSDIIQDATGGIEITRGVGSADTHVLSLISTQAEANSLLVLNKSPSALNAGNAIDVTMNANATGDVLAATDGTTTFNLGFNPTTSGFGAGLSVVGEDFVFEIAQPPAGSGTVGYRWFMNSAAGADASGATAAAAGGIITLKGGAGGAAAAGTGAAALGGSAFLVGGVGGAGSATATTGAAGGAATVSAGAGGDADGAGTAGEGGIAALAAGAGGSSTGTGGTGGALIVASGDGGPGGTGSTSGSATLRSGAGAGTDGNTGNVFVDSGAPTGSGTAGTVRIGVTSAAGVDLGRAAGQLRFFGGTGSTRPTITGERAAVPGLGNLLSALDTMGIVVDSTTAGTGGGGAPQYFGASRRQEIDDLLLATEVKLGAFTLDPTLFSGATFAFSFTATVTDGGGAAASLTLRLYDMGAPGTPIAPVLLSDITLSITGSIRRVEQALTTSGSPGVNADEIYDTERIYEVRAELTGDVGDFAEIDWAGILGT